MKLKRKVQLTLYSLFSIITGNRYYICEDCHRIHKKTGNELALCGGWYAPYIFVSYECADRTIQQARMALFQAVTNKHERRYDDAHSP